MEQDVNREVHIGYLLKVISCKLKARVDEDLGRHGLTFSQTRILRFLREQGGEATQKAIENHLKVAHPTVVGMIRRMEQNGFVESRFDPQDRRIKYVRSTEKAKRLDREMDLLVEHNEECLLSGLSAEQISELRKALQIIYRSMDI